jgi:hypothetical protein
MDRQPLDHDQVIQREQQLDIAGLAYDITIRAQAHPDPTKYAEWLHWQRLYTVSLPFSPFICYLVVSFLPALISLLLPRCIPFETPPNTWFISATFTPLSVS